MARLARAEVFNPSEVLFSTCALGLFVAAFFLASIRLLEKTTIIGKFGSKISSDFMCSLRRLKSDPRSLSRNHRNQPIHIGATSDSGLGASSFFAR